METSFEDYLHDLFHDAYPATLDDDLVDKFDDWLTELSPEEWIKIGQAFGDQLINPPIREIKI